MIILLYPKKKVKFHVLIWKNLALNTEKPSKNTIFQFQTWVSTAEINKIKIDFLSKLTLLACRSIYKLVDCFHSYLHNIYKWNFLRLNIISKVRTFWAGHKNLKQPPTWFDIYLVNVKSSERLFQIFVAFYLRPKSRSKIPQNHLTSYVNAPLGIVGMKILMNFIPK